MKTWNVHEGLSYDPGKVVGSVKANTAKGAKQKWRKEMKANGDDKFSDSYWFVHCVKESN